MKYCRASQSSKYRSMSNGSRVTARCLVIPVLSVETPVLLILASLFIIFQLTQRKEQFGYELDESDLKPYSRVCSRHFPDGDAKKRNNVRFLPGTATYIIYTTHQYIGVVGDKKEIASLNVELQNQFSKLTLLGFFEARKRYVSFCCCIQVD